MSWSSFLEQGPAVTGLDPGSLSQTQFRTLAQTWQGPSKFSVSPQTDYFHLFICVAIVAIYGDDVIEQQLATDQMLLHFGNLAMHMNGELVLRKVGAQAGPVRPALHIGRPHGGRREQDGRGRMGVLGSPCRVF